MDVGTRARWTAERPGRTNAVDAACIAPWVSLEFDPQGWVYSCCANQQYPVGRIGHERLSDIWDGPRVAVLRETLGRWDMSNGCASCRWHLEHGRTDTDAAVYDRYPLTSASPPGPASMTFALSNRCNLACVMCNGELSSTIRHRQGLPPLHSPYDDQFFDDLAPFLPGLRYAKFLGGEPLLVPDHHRVWRMMDEVGGPPRLQITTNGTIWNDRVEWLINRFDVDVTVSIDAASSAAYERIRPGADHDVVVRNVERFRDRCREVGTELRLCFCLMSHNWEELAPFLRWADELDAPVSINVVSDTGHALHDLDEADLEHVDRFWSRQADEGAAPSGCNSATWSTQLRQLRSVLSERRAGSGVPSRHARSAEPLALATQSAARVTLRGTPSVLPAERDRLARWSDGGLVGELEVRDGMIVSVPNGHPALGVTARLVGLGVDLLIDEIAESDGRPAWTIDDDTSDDVSVRTLVLAQGAPERGRPGTVVRIVSVPQPGGWAVLIGADRIHERSAPVAITPRRAAVAAAPQRTRSDP